MGEDPVRELVLQILARGRLQQQELSGDVAVRDGGINMRVGFFTERMNQLIREHTIDIVNVIIGKDVELHPTTDVREGEQIPDYKGEAINQTKNQQRQLLELYKENKL